MSITDLDGSIHRLVLDRLRDWHGIDPAQVGYDRPLAELGVTSRDAVALAAEISELTGIALPATLLWEAGTLDQLARRVRVVGGGEDAGERIAVTPVPPSRPQPPAPVAIAVVGIGCRLPGGIDSAAQYWHALRGGLDAVGTVPPGRWDGFVAPDDPVARQVSRHGGFLADVAGFDAEFFGIAPSEAAAMDPQQRLVLEVAREALDHAAIPAGSLAGTRTGVFVGISGNEYARLTTADLDRVEGWTAPGAALSIAANRLSYAWDLRGPSMAVDTACSSSLVAVHHAVRALVSGECDTALVGGVNVLLSPMVTFAFQRAGALAPDGRCKPFDASADGMVRAEGCAMVALRRLSDAERNGDRVLAVILGTAVNSDGRSNGLLAPNAEAQRALLAEVYQPGGAVAPHALDYVEAHGTGTALGDPVEAGALGAVLGHGRASDQPLLIGSVKSNLGHLEAAAGIAGLAKTVLALHHDELPPQLHFSSPSPHIDFDALALRVVSEAEPWPRYSGTATAGVSAFGFGGTNAHILLQEYRPAPSAVHITAHTTLVSRASVSGAVTITGGPAVGVAPSVLALDAPTPERLREDAAELADWLRSGDGSRARLADVAHTLSGRLGRGRHRAAVVARTRDQACGALSAVAAGKPDPATVSGVIRPAAPQAVWVFSGYGSQWPGMARRLIAEEPAFAAALDRLDALLRRHATGLSVHAQLEPDAELTSPSVVQPVLFALQVALAELWRAHGFTPSAVIGHSMGEVAAAVVAGSVDEEDGVRIIAARSRLLNGLSGGAMAVVDRTPEEVEKLAERLTSLRIAVHSSPRQCVVAGSAEHVSELITVVAGEGGLAKALPVAVAGHTPQVDPILKPFEARLGAVPHRPPACRLYTTVDEDPRRTPDLGTEYWVRNLREPVRFRQAVTAAAEDGHRAFIEISPHPTQLYPLAETLRAAGIEDALVLPTLRRDTDEAVTFRLSLASLLVNGAVDLVESRRTLHPRSRIVDVPSARWRHRCYWVDAPVEVAVSQAPAVTVPRRRELGTRDRLRACVAQVMGYRPESIGDDTPLTDLGLDSLHAVRIMSAVRHEFGIELAAGTLLRRGTVAQVAELLEEGQAPTTVQARGVLPRDATERLVARAWESVTSGEVGGVEDELVALAADPRLAVDLARALTERIGQEVDPSALAEGPATVAALADRMRPLVETPVEGPLRVFRAGGTQPPLFLVHPAGGSAAVYRALVDRLGADVPCFGLERLPECDEVTEQAVEYARLIRELRPDGPWAIGGWSFGGVVGQETARLLAPHGLVSAVVLIDSVLPLPDPGLDLGQEARRRFAGFAEYVERVYGSPLILPYDELARLDDVGQIDLLIKILRETVDLPAAVLEHQRDSYLDLRSGERHSPAAYSGRALLYRATEAAPHTVRDARYERDDDALGWDQLCPDLSVRPVPGHHLSLLDPPAVDELARLLDADLRGVPAAPRS
ncbi:MAG TPA: type I polyketide synthase [Actinocrinis sp.]|uniref:type I polyketide synthase n=1 Tax=Actinocrinis sp. TaxID=1920516 RepID=UPI002DDD1013|nr:type I polyketide synthase [Actinocrinis sp.]HEV3170544.1 type I polyketide synthase [Actinocrinis sp.]